jgi:HEAT repeat protein
MRAVEVAALVLFAVSVLIILALVARRSVLARSTRVRSALAEQLRPAALELVSGDRAEPVPELRGAEAEVFAELVGGYARRVTGDARERVGGYFEASGAVDDQLRRLGSRRAWRRASAAFALGDMCSPRAVPELERALGDAARDVRLAAGRSLGRLGALEAIEPLIAASLERRVPQDVAGLALFDLGPAAVPRLVELTGNAEPAVRSKAVELVGLLGDAGDARPVLERLRDSAAAVREASADALGRLGAAEGRDALVRALDDRVPAVRAAAARALGRTGGRRAADALLPVARGDAFEPARAAAEALAQIDPTAVLYAAMEPDAGPHLLEAADLLLL